jgi:hypothetical protein
MQQKEKNHPHLRIAHRKNKRLRPISTPQLLFIKRRRIKHNLIHNLRQMHWKPLWTFAPRLHAHWRCVRLVRYLCVRYVALVVWRVEIHAVPACGESDLGAYAAFAEARGEEGCVFFGAGRAAEGVCVFVHAAVADASGLTGGVA